MRNIDFVKKRYPPKLTTKNEKMAWQTAWPTIK